MTVRLDRVIDALDYMMIYAQAYRRGYRSNSEYGALIDHRFNQAKEILGQLIVEKEMAMNIHSTQEIAQALGISERGVRWLASSLGVGKRIGSGRRGVWVFDDTDLETLKNRRGKVNDIRSN